MSRAVGKKGNRQMEAKWFTVISYKAYFTLNQNLLDEFDKRPAIFNEILISIVDMRM